MYTYLGSIPVRLSPFICRQLPHLNPGVLSLVDGRTARFHITFRKTEELDGWHAVFGKVQINWMQFLDAVMDGWHAVFGKVHLNQIQFLVILTLIRKTKELDGWHAVFGKVHINWMQLLILIIPIQKTKELDAGLFRYNYVFFINTNTEEGRTRRLARGVWKGTS